VKPGVDHTHARAKLLDKEKWAHFTSKMARRWPNLCSNRYLEVTPFSALASATRPSPSRHPAYALATRPEDSSQLGDVVYYRLTNTVSSPFRTVKPIPFHHHFIPLSSPCSRPFEVDEHAPLLFVNG
jgi:hypothetical protein